MIQEGAQPRIHVLRRNCHACRRDRGSTVSGLPRLAASISRLGQIVGHFAQAIHVVGKGDQMGGNVGHGLEGLAHPAGARDLAEGADMRQAGGAIAGLEQHSVRPAFRPRSRASTRASSLRASSNGQALAASACSRDMFHGKFILR